ncbi:MAG: hypothetical protein ACFB10_04980 [Salibacteraceae bacterium]
MLLLLVLAGCRDVFEAPRWDVDLLAPIAKTTLDLQDLDQDSLLRENNDRSLTLVFSEKLFSLELDSLFEIPEQRFDTNTPSYPFSVNLPPGNSLYTDVSNNKFDASGAELTNAKVREGTIELTLLNTLNEGVLFTYSIPSAKLGAQVFRKQELLPAGSIAAPTQSSFTYDLAGYELDLTGPNGNDHNTIILDVEAVVDPGGQIVNVAAGTYLGIKSRFSAVRPEYVEGYFGQSTERATSDGEPTDLFNYVQNGEFDLEEVNLDLRIRNGVGVDFTAEILGLTSINSETNTTIALTHPTIGSSLNVNRAGISGLVNTSPDVLFSDFDLSFDQSNSNLDELIENQPDQLGYQVDLTLNPLGNVSNHRDFLFYDKGIDIFLDLEVPLSFSANNLTLLDTTELEIADREEFIYIVSGGFLYAYVDIGYPFDATIQLVMLDSNFNFIDSLVVPTTVIPAAPVNAILRVDGTSSAKLPIPINQNQIDDFYAARYLATRISLTTTSQPDFIKIYSDYRMDLKVVADFTYRVDEF